MSLVKKHPAVVGIFLTFTVVCVCFFSFCNTKNELLTDNFNIVLITVDTLRADHLSCYGYQRKTSPNIDKIAKSGILFTHTLATAPWTSPSMASIMTSLYPISHGVCNKVVKSDKGYRQDVLNDKLITIADILKKNGYTTFAAVANVHMRKELGFGQGFDHYYCEGFNNASNINDVLFSWNDKIRESGKYFLWAHYFDPHDPYSARIPWINDYAEGLEPGVTGLSKMMMTELRKNIPGFREEKDIYEYLLALYDSEISYTDYYIGKLIDSLDLDNNSLIIITSDHGEEFFEHGSLGHEQTLYNELLHVPLIIKLPAAFSELHEKTTAEPSSIIDIMPTILGMLDIKPPDVIEGKNLFEKKGETRGEKGDYIFSERVVSKAVIHQNRKYIYHYCTQKEQLFDILNDPGELNNIVNLETANAKKLKNQLLTWVSRSLEVSPIQKIVHFDENTEKQLRALGYISEVKTEGIKPYSGSCSVEVCH